MRKAVKLLHTVSSAGMVGGLLGYMVLLGFGPHDTPSAYANTRQSISALADYVLLPSMAVALVTGLFAMVVHTPFLELRWVWLKALLGIGTFEGTLSLIGSKAHHGVRVAAEIAAGAPATDALEAAISREWVALGVVMALVIANVVIGIWRPALTRRQRRPARQARGPTA